MEFLSHISAVVLFGVVQGLTEFLPVSSSGHLLLLHSIINLHAVNEVTFDVALHVGTLLALLVYFWKDIVRLVQAAWAWLFHRSSPGTPDQRLVWLILVASVPGAVLGVALESWFESAVREPWLVAIMLIVAGIGLWLADRFAKRAERIEWLRPWQAFLIGCGQAIALIPGISRSGASITFGRLLGLEREAAARFSFLMAIPIMAGAAAKKALDLRGVAVSGQQYLDMVLGIVVAAIVGYIAIRVLLRFVSTRSYTVFAVYRVILGVVVLGIVFFMR